MRIGLFTDHYTYSNEQGSAFYFSSLLENEHEVYIITPDCDEDLKNDHVLLLPSLNLKKMQDFFNPKGKHTSLFNQLRALELNLLQSTSQFGTGSLARLVSENLRLPLVSYYKQVYQDAEEFYQIDGRHQIDKTMKSLLNKINMNAAVKSSTILVSDHKTYKSLEKEGYDVHILDQKEPLSQLDEIYQNTIHQYFEVYTLEQVKFKDDTVLLTISNHKNSMDILVSMDNYIDLSLHKEMEVDEDLITVLLKNEILTHAYLGALHKLKYKDRTVKEMHDYLKKEFSLKEAEISELNQRLLDRGYLNDQRYAENMVDRLQSQLKGPKLVRKELLSKGIDAETIQTALSNHAKETEDENEMAFLYASKIARTIHNKSLNIKKSFIRSKLLQRGYNNDVTDIAMSRLDFDEDLKNELDVLQKAAIKAKNRSERKLSGKALRNKVIQTLLTQGFRYEDVLSVINEMEWEDEQEIY